MVQDLMKIMEDPKPGLELSESLLKLSSRTMLNIYWKYAKNSALEQEFVMKRSKIISM